MQSLTDPTATTIIGTCAALTIGFTIVAIKEIIAVRNFRESIKPGDYANIETNKGLTRAKMLSKYLDNYGFTSIDTKEFFIVQKSKIYPL